VPGAGSRAAGSWLGCGDGFADVLPRYRRSIDSFAAPAAAHGVDRDTIETAVHPATGRPLSAPITLTRGAPPAARAPDLNPP
jgi:hypothetical protein